MRQIKWPLNCNTCQLIQNLWLKLVRWSIRKNHLYCELIKLYWLIRSDSVKMMRGCRSLCLIILLLLSIILKYHCNYFRMLIRIRSRWECKKLRIKIKKWNRFLIILCCLWPRVMLSRIFLSNHNNGFTLLIKAKILSLMKIYLRANLLWGNQGWEDVLELPRITLDYNHIGKSNKCFPPPLNEKPINLK